MVRQRLLLGKLKSKCHTIIYILNISFEWINELKVYRNAIPILFIFENPILLNLKIFLCGLREMTFARSK